MVGEIGFVLAMVLVVVVVRRVGPLLRVPDAVLLTVVGIVYALLPGPNLSLRPTVILDVVLPPLLYSAALSSSLLAIRSLLRPVVSLSVALVAATALVVGGLVAWLVPIVPLAAAVALGAAAAPTDPVAALSVGRRAGLPARLATLIEGEGLLNDATALTLYDVAVTAAVGGGFSFALAAGEFALAAVGGAAVGAAIAGLVWAARRLFPDPLSVNAVSLATPFAAYALGTVAHVSGVLAVVIAGLIIGHYDPRLNTGASRLQASAVWRLVGFLLEGLVFLLIGQQLPAVVRGLDQYATGTIALTVGITVGVVLVLRPLWLVVTQHVPRWVHARLGGVPEPGGDQPLSGREITALSWAGTRGVITLAAASAIPLTTHTGAPFPARPLLLFSAYLVVLVTLLGQGTTFGPLLRRLGLRADVRDEARLRNRARAAAVDAALARLDQLTEVPDQVIVELRRGLTARRERYRRRLAHLEDDPKTPYPPGYEAAVQARRAIIDAQQEELLRWRDAGQLPDEMLRTLQRELDHEEHTLPRSG